MNSDFRKGALVLALRRMLSKDGHFSICTFDSCLALAGITITKDEREPFLALHCVDYSEMPDGFKRELALHLTDIFSRSPSFQFDIEAIIEPAPTIGGKLLNFFGK